MKDTTALRMPDMSKYGGLPLEYDKVPVPVWRVLHPRSRMVLPALAHAGVVELNCKYSNPKQQFLLFFTYLLSASLLFLAFACMRRRYYSLRIA